MSMHAKFVQITPDRLKELIDDPSDLIELFENGGPSMKGFANLTEEIRDRIRTQSPQMLTATLARMNPVIREGLEKRLESLGIGAEVLKSGNAGDAILQLMNKRGLFRDPNHFADEPPQSGALGARSGSPGPVLSLDKAWHGIHFLLCGKAEPDPTLAGQAVMGGTELGDDESGYGPARYFAPDEVRAIAAELSRQTIEAEMKARFDPAAMVKAGIYPGGWQAGGDDWLFDGFRQLRQLFADASAQGLAVITCIV